MKQIENEISSELKSDNLMSIKISESTNDEFSSSTVLYLDKDLYEKSNAAPDITSKAAQSRVSAMCYAVTTFRRVGVGGQLLGIVSTRATFQYDGKFAYVDLSRCSVSLDRYDRDFSIQLRGWDMTDGNSMFNTTAKAMSKYWVKYKMITVAGADTAWCTKNGQLSYTTQNGYV